MLTQFKILSIYDNVFLCFENLNEQDIELQNNIWSELVRTHNISGIKNISPVLRIKTNFQNENSGQMTIKLNSEIISRVKISFSKLIKSALKNTFENHICSTMHEVLCEQLGVNPDEFPNALETPELYVASNTNKIHGASALINTTLLKEIGMKTNKNLLIILPSSIHEILVYTVDDLPEIENFKNMVAEVNDTQVEPEERLSYNVYVYDIEKDTYTTY